MTRLSLVLGTTQCFQTQTCRMIVAVFLHARTSDVSATWCRARGSREYTVVLPWLTSTLLLFSLLRTDVSYQTHTHFTASAIQPISIDNQLQQSDSDHIPQSVTKISFIETIYMHCLFCLPETFDQYEGTLDNSASAEMGRRQAIAGAGKYKFHAGAMFMVGMSAAACSPPSLPYLRKFGVRGN